MQNSARRLTDEEGMNQQEATDYVAGFYGVSEQTAQHAVIEATYPGGLAAWYGVETENSPNPRMLLEALNSRPAIRQLMDKDGRPVGPKETFPNRAAAKAAPVPEGMTAGISVYMLDLVDGS